MHQSVIHFRPPYWRWSRMQKSKTKTKKDNCCKINKTNKTTKCDCFVCIKGVEWEKEGKELPQWNLWTFWNLGVFRLPRVPLATGLLPNRRY